MNLRGIASTTERPRRRSITFVLWLVSLPLLAGPRQVLAQTLSTAFGDYSAIPVGSWPEAVAIGDLNADGRNDVVLGTSTSGTSTNNLSILIFFQTGNGGLAAPGRYPAGGAANSIVIADFTGDGKNDIAVATGSAGIRVFLQGPGGGFDSFTNYPAANANWICSADFNNDGRSDVAGIGWSSEQVDVFTQTANGTLGFAGQHFANYDGWNDLEAGDVNNDGLSDIIVMSGQGAAPNLNVLLQTHGGFAAAVPYDLGGNEETAGVGVRDPTGDGRNDIAVSFGGNRPSSKVSVFNQQTDGTFLRGPTFDSYDIPESVVVADVDLNGRPDILTLHGGWNRLGVYFQTSPGGFDTEKLFVIPYASHYDPHGLAVGDINGDQMPDVVIADYNNGLVVLTNRLAPPPVPVRQLTGMDLSDGTARFTLNGPVGSSFDIEGSSDLVTWLPLLTNTVSPGGSVGVTDSEMTGQLSRFYRATPHAGGGTFNDFFSNRVAIASSGDTVFGSNVGATKESGELNHGGDAGGKSVWWTWTAPAGGVATVTTDGSSFDTTLAVYRGTTVGSLTLTAQDDDGGEGVRSRVIFNATGGVVYQIAVDGYSGESGDITLTVKPGVLNDAFADRLQITGSADVVVGSNVGATRETNEPEHWPGTGGASVWWTWQATLSGTVTISTAGSFFDTLLAAYIGSPETGLALVANNDDFGANVTSQISFFATAGMEYQIAVDGFGAATGTIRLALQP